MRDDDERVRRMPTQYNVSGTCYLYIFFFVLHYDYDPRRINSMINVLTRWSLYCFDVSSSRKQK